MPSSQLNRHKRLPINLWPFKTEILFPQGLFGFEHLKRFHLIGHQEERPMMRLQAIDDNEVSFYVVDPFLQSPHYTPTFKRKDFDDLHVVYEAKLFLLAIVNKNELPHFTNLTAPLLIHWSKKLGKQITVDNAAM